MKTLKEGDRVKYINVDDVEYSSEIFSGTIVEILTGSWYDWFMVHWDVDIITTIHKDRLEVIDQKPWEKYNSAYTPV